LYILQAGHLKNLTDVEEWYQKSSDLPAGQLPTESLPTFTAEKPESLSWAAPWRRKGVRGKSQCQRLLEEECGDKSSRLNRCSETQKASGGKKKESAELAAQVSGWIGTARAICACAFSLILQNTV